MQDEVGYARTRTLGAFSFFNLNKSDAALLWSAMAFVDPLGTERVSISAFGAAFCPNSSQVLELLWDKYTWSKPLKAYKASVVHVDEDDPDALEGLDGEAELQGKAKERHLKALEEQKRKLAERNIPTYVQFISFLLFFMSTTEKTLPRWLYWLWFHIPNIKPSVERLQAMVNDIWPKNNDKREKYKLAVFKGVKVVDEGFDAATFGIYNAKTGGAFARPALMVKKDLYVTLGQGQSFWTRMTAGVEKSLGDFAGSMERLEDRKLKGVPTLYAGKGERKQTRREMRKFLGRYVDFTTGMKTNEEAIEGTKGVLLPLIKSVLSATFKSVVAASSKVDLGSKSDFVRKLQIARKLEAWHTRRREEAEAEEAARDAAKVATTSSNLAGENIVPLEWKYRKQIRWPQEALNAKAHSATDSARDLVDRVRKEVLSVKLVVGNFRVGAELFDDDQDHDQEEEEEGSERRNKVVENDDEDSEDD